MEHAQPLEDGKRLLETGTHGAGRARAFRAAPPQPRNAHHLSLHLPLSPPSPQAHPTNYSAAQALLEEAKAAAGVDPDAHFDLLVMSANVDGRGKGVAAALRGLLVFAAIASARAAVCTEETKPDMWAGGPGTTPTAPASPPHDPREPTHPCHAPRAGCCCAPHPPTRSRAWRWR